MFMSAAIEQSLTADEFARLPDNGKQQALVRGEVVETMPPGGEYAWITSEIDFQLRAWIKRGIGGFLGVEAGFRLSRTPDTVRATDVAYVRADRIPNEGIPKGFWNIAPDLAVEVVSPGETADEVRDKVRDYLQAGTLLVWVVYPRSKDVVMHMYCSASSAPLQICSASDY
jgi:Uma2 family endonuclease